MTEKSNISQKHVIDYPMINVLKIIIHTFFYSLKTTQIVCVTEQNTNELAFDNVKTLSLF